jgi:hypothetical protein
LEHEIVSFERLASEPFRRRNHEIDAKFQSARDEIMRKRKTKKASRADWKRFEKPKGLTQAEMDEEIDKDLRNMFAEIYVEERLQAGRDATRCARPRCRPTRPAGWFPAATLCVSGPHFGETLFI